MDDKNYENALETFKSQKLRYTLDYKTKWLKYL